MLLIGEDVYGILFCQFFGVVLILGAAALS